MPDRAFLQTTELRCRLLRSQGPQRVAVDRQVIGSPLVNLRKETGLLFSSYWMVLHASDHLLKYDTGTMCVFHNECGFMKEEILTWPHNLIEIHHCLYFKNFIKLLHHFHSFPFFPFHIWSLIETLVFKASFACLKESVNASPYHEITPFKEPIMNSKR